MKRKLLIISLILSCITLIYAYIPQKEVSTHKEPNKTQVKSSNNADLINKINGKSISKSESSHSQQEIDCKSCHYCEYPTSSDPCLVLCPRNEMISIHHSPSEGPEIVIMNDLPGEWGAVAFTHKLHAEMAEMSGGCASCHHYNTTGPVLKCKSCHELNRLREDLSKPDLEGAYHRQCVNCHRQWSRTTECNYCHFEKGIDAEKARKIKMEQYAGKGHPKVLPPEKVIYETNYANGKLVTFFHDEHTSMFRIECKTCHKDENCMSCHDVRSEKLRTKNNRNYSKKIHKTFDEHHKACNSCHNENNCSKCHLDKEMQRFDHRAATGFDLSKYHSNLACKQCHSGSDFQTKLSPNCLSCHSKTFKVGSFDHRKAGYLLDETHNEFDCSDCHKNSDFSKGPICSDCHDDPSYSKKLPKMRKR